MTDEPNRIDTFPQLNDEEEAWLDADIPLVIPPFFMGYICRLCSPFRLFQFHCGRYAADAHVGAIIVVCP